MQTGNPAGLNCTVAIVSTHLQPGNDGFIAIAALSNNGLMFALIVACDAGPDALPMAARAIAGNVAANSASP